MSSVSAIQKAIIGLSRDDYHQLRRCDFTNTIGQMGSADRGRLCDGKLDPLAAQAVEAKRRGTLKDL